METLLESGSTLTLDHLGMMLCIEHALYSTQPPNGRQVDALQKWMLNKASTFHLRRSPVVPPPCRAFCQASPPLGGCEGGEGGNRRAGPAANPGADNKSPPPNTTGEDHMREYYTILLDVTNRTPLNIQALMDSMMDLAQKHLEGMSSFMAFCSGEEYLGARGPHGMGGKNPLAHYSCAIRQLYQWNRLVCDTLPIGTFTRLKQAAELYWPQTLSLALKGATESTGSNGGCGATKPKTPTGVFATKEGSLQQIEEAIHRKELPKALSLIQKHFDVTDPLRQSADCLSHSSTAANPTGGAGTSPSTQTLVTDPLLGGTAPERLTKPLHSLVAIDTPESMMSSHQRESMTIAAVKPTVNLASAYAMIFYSQTYLALHCTNQAKQYGDMAHLIARQLSHIDPAILVAAHYNRLLCSIATGDSQSAGDDISIVLQLTQPMVANSDSSGTPGAGGGGGAGASATAASQATLPQPFLRFRALALIAFAELLLHYPSAVHESLRGAILRITTGDEAPQKKSIGAGLDSVGKRSAQGSQQQGKSSSTNASGFSRSATSAVSQTRKDSILSSLLIASAIITQLNDNHERVRLQAMVESAYVDMSSRLGIVARLTVEPLLSVFLSIHTTHQLFLLEALRLAHVETPIMGLRYFFHSLLTPASRGGCDYFIRADFTFDVGMLLVVRSLHAAGYTVAAYNLLKGQLKELRARRGVGTFALSLQVDYLKSGFDISCSLGYFDEAKESFSVEAQRLAQEFAFVQASLAALEMTAKHRQLVGDIPQALELTKELQDAGKNLQVVDAEITASLTAASCRLSSPSAHVAVDNENSERMVTEGDGVEGLGAASLRLRNATHFQKYRYWALRLWSVASKAYSGATNKKESTADDRQNRLALQGEEHRALKALGQLFPLLERQCMQEALSLESTICQLNRYDRNRKEHQQQEEGGEALLARGREVLVAARKKALKEAYLAIGLSDPSQMVEEVLHHHEYSASAGIRRRRSGASGAGGGSGATKKNQPSPLALKAHQRCRRLQAGIVSLDLPIESICHEALVFLRDPSIGE